MAAEIESGKLYKVRVLTETFLTPVQHLCSVHFPSLRVFTFALPAQSCPAAQDFDLARAKAMDTPVGQSDAEAWKRAVTGIRRRVKFSRRTDPHGHSPQVLLAALAAATDASDVWSQMADCVSLGGG